MRENIMKKSAARLSKTARYVGRRSRSAQSEVRELSEVQAEMKKEAQRGANQMTHGIDSSVLAATDFNNARCRQCGRKITIPITCAQCAEEISKAVRIKRQKSVRGG